MFLLIILNQQAKNLFISFCYFLVKYFGALKFKFSYLETFLLVFLSPYATGFKSGCGQGEEQQEWAVLQVL